MGDSKDETKQSSFYAKHNLGFLLLSQISEWLYVAWREPPKFLWLGERSNHIQQAMESTLVGVRYYNMSLTKTALQQLHV
jgi:hypothetical protein